MYFYNRLKASEVRGLVQHRIKLIASASLLTKILADFLVGFVFTKLGA